jgi:uncharacterized membrane protein
MCLNKIKKILNKIKECCEKHPLGLMILIFIISLILTAIAFYVLLPEDVAKIEVELQKLDVSLSPGENYTKTISITVNEAGNVALNAIGPIKDWVPSINRSFHVEENEKHYINVEFVNLSNATLGEYKGRIEITHNGSVEAKIPILLTIEPREITPKNVSILLVP